MNDKKKMSRAEVIPEETNNDSKSDEPEKDKAQYDSFYHKLAQKAMTILAERLIEIDLMGD